MFLSKDYMIKVLQRFAIAQNFQFKTVKSCTARYNIICCVSPCTWKLSVSSNKNLGCWTVRKYVNVHDPDHRVDIITNYHQQASSSLISQCIKPNFDIFDADRITPKDIRSSVQKDLKVNISYFKAWNAKRLALQQIRGYPAESYSLLPFVANLLTEKNLGTRHNILVNENREFLYFFISFGASINGWQYCRPVISIDGTFLKSKFQGTLLIASALDGNNHIFPLGFAIVDSENDASYHWFLTQLKDAIGVRDDLVIISDRHLSIPKAIQNIFPTALHAICMQHLVSNLVTKFHIGAIQPFFYNCASAYTSKDYEFYMSLLMRIDPNIKPYLDNADPRRWSRSLFPGKRYNMMITNISESMNAKLKEARCWPVAQLVLEFLNILQNWFQKHTDQANSMKSSLPDKAFELLLDYEDKRRCMQVKTITAQEFEVHDTNEVIEVVNIRNRSCTCRV